MLNVNVYSFVFGDSENQKPLPVVTLKLASQRLSAEEIITATVKEQLQNLLINQSDYTTILNRLNSQYLNETEIKEQASSGKIAISEKEASQISLNRETKRVLSAFKNKRFKMFVDREEIIDLKDMCTITENTEVKFIRLVPLAGG